ncbi:hypothetical protein E2562_016127, partial [Oryza meyeriana var. granulata]
SQVVAGLPSSSKEADNWAKNDEVEYVGVDDEKEKYKDLIKKLPYKHNCASIAGVENNCMATNSWVRDRVCNYTICICRSTPSRVLDVRASSCVPHKDMGLTATHQCG